jgi:hypothetical protein
MCDKFQKSLDNARDRANALRDEYGGDSTQYKDAIRAIDAYGKENVDNGVTVQIGDAGGYNGQTDVNPSGDSPTGYRCSFSH